MGLRDRVRWAVQCMRCTTAWHGMHMRGGVGERGARVREGRGGR